MIMQSSKVSTLWQQRSNRNGSWGDYNKEKHVFRETILETSTSHNNFILTIIAWEDEQEDEEEKEESDEEDEMCEEEEEEDDRHRHHHHQTRFHQGPAMAKTAPKHNALDQEKVNFSQS